jgi:hypothetical protein
MNVSNFQVFFSNSFKPKIQKKLKNLKYKNEQNKRQLTYW